MSIDQNFEHGLSKLKTAQNQNARVIRTALQKLRNELKTAGITSGTTAKDTHSAITQQLKVYHAHISKYTKALDKVKIMLCQYVDLTCDVAVVGLSFRSHVST
jgi:DNA-binding helix-hairpin-helix protein with protein kinase domain